MAGNASRDLGFSSRHGLLRRICIRVWNGGVAVGDARQHPFPALYFGNPYFFLFIVFVLFLPLHVPAFRRLWSFLNPKRTVLCCSPFRYSSFYIG